MLNEDNVTMNVGEKLQLEATLLPEELDWNEVKWVSEDEAVATVEDGLVIALIEGTTTIKVLAYGKEAKCNIVVKEDEINLETDDNSTNFDVPKTGDTNSIAMSASLLILSGGILLAFKKKNRNNRV